MTHWKSIPALLLIAALLLTLTGCIQPVLPSGADSSSRPVTDSAQSQPPPSPPDLTTDPQLLQYLRENLPKMDGSTSLIPLEAGIRAELLGISTEEATKQVVHSSTYGSYYNLLSGQADLIFSVPLSPQQIAEAAGLGISLEQVPVAQEGFVFVVNAQNPVDALSQQQLQDIYSGRITNWKEVGGNDEPIMAYQRNEESGSQNYMHTFMGDTPLMDAPTEKRPATMSGLMDVIAANDYASASIGYSVYAYAADMYGTGNEIKFIKVDGIQPTKSSMAAGEYPLLSQNYAVFNADQPADSPVRQLCGWLTTDHGQYAIAKAGYVTVRDIGFDYSEPPMVMFAGTGTGAVLGSTPITCSVPVFPDCGAGEIPLKVTLPEQLNIIEQYDTTTPYTTGIRYELTCLADTDLQAQINAWIGDAVEAADKRADELQAFIDRQDSGEYHMLQQDYSPYHSDIYPAANVEARSKNGYLWVTVYQRYIFMSQDGENRYYHTDAAVWDLITGERLTLTDLFPEGTDIASLLNSWLAETLQKPLDSWRNYAPLMQEFTGLPEKGWVLTPEALYFNADTPYFPYGLRFPLRLPDGSLVTEQYRSSNGCFVGDVRMADRFAESHNPPVLVEMQDGWFPVALLDETVGNANVRRRINQDFLSRIAHITYENAKAYFESRGIDSEPETFMYGWNLEEYTDRFVVFSASNALSCYSGEMYEFWQDSCGAFLYDLGTGERMSAASLLKDGWRESAFVRSWDESGEMHDDPATDFVWDDAKLSGLRPADEGAGYLAFSFRPTPEETVELYVPEENVIF